MLKTAITKTSIDKIIIDFNAYKQTIDCHGAILLDEKLEYVLVIKAFRSDRFGFPKGKMKIKEEKNTK